MIAEIIPGWKGIIPGSDKITVAMREDGAYVIDLSPAAIGDGSGDMLKSVYDANNSGVVDAAESVEWGGVVNVPSAFPPSAHDHDERYYTETETNALLGERVARSLFDANTILKADVDNTPSALSVPASTIVGRGASGGIAALDASSARTVLALAATDTPQFAGVVTSYVAVTTDGATAFQIRRSNKTTPVLTVNTTDVRLGLNTSLPMYLLDIRENVNLMVALAHLQNSSNGTGAATQFRLSNDADHFLDLGILSSTHTAQPKYGEPSDSFNRLSNAAGHYNFIAANPNKSIRFYGGRNANTLPSLIARLNSIGVNVTLPTFSNGDGVDIGGANLRLRVSRTPASSTAPGNVGEFCWDSNYFYICVATDTWRRVAHSSW